MCQCWEWERHCFAPVVVHAIARVTEVRMVQEIKGLEPELQIEALRDIEVLLRSEIYVEDGNSGHYITPRVAKGVLGLQGESLDIEPLVWRRVAERELLPGDHVRTVVPDARV